MTNEGGTNTSEATSDSTTTTSAPNSSDKEPYFSSSISSNRESNASATASHDGALLLRPLGSKPTASDSIFTPKRSNLSSDSGNSSSTCALQSGPAASKASPASEASNGNISITRAFQIDPAVNSASPAAESKIATVVALACFKEMLHLLQSQFHF